MGREEEVRGPGRGNVNINSYTLRYFIRHNAHCEKDTVVSWNPYAQGVGLTSSLLLLRLPTQDRAVVQVWVNSMPPGSGPRTSHSYIKHVSSFASISAVRGKGSGLRRSCSAPAVQRVPYRGSEHVDIPQAYARPARKARSV